ncbi:MAG: hypothetical protein WCI84_02110, partial [Bacteroidota bacterium]
TGLRGYSDYKGKTINTSGFAKTKTFFQLVVIYLFLVDYIVRTSEYLNYRFGWFFDVTGSPSIMFLLMGITTALTALTGVMYLNSNKKIISELFSHERHDAAAE